jgi:ferritin-like metal-binding protein YciE
MPALETLHEQTLKEESLTDEKLTELAQKVNPKAEAADEAEARAE